MCNNIALCTSFGVALPWKIVTVPVQVTGTAPRVTSTTSRLAIPAPNAKPPNLAARGTTKGWAREKGKAGRDQDRARTIAMTDAKKT